MSVTGIFRPTAGNGRSFQAKPRSAPANFAEMVRAHPTIELKRVLHASWKTIVRWHEETGVPRRDQKLPIPADFMAVAATLTAPVLAKRFGVCEGLIHKWRVRCGVVVDQRAQCRAGAYLIPVPADLREKAKDLNMEALKRHYGRSGKTINRWLSELGIEAKPYREPKPEKAPAKRWVNYGAPHQVKLDNARDTSLEGLAAEHLRCATRAPIYRCTERGIADPQGPLWRYGNVVLSRAELFVRAHRHGFEARRFAA